MRRILVLATAMLWLVPAANAGDGVVEINQACVSVGCFSGDDPDWPVQIESPGSYILTSNLTVPDANTSGIHVSANDVGIDLNNFAIRGPVVCVGGDLSEPLTCTAGSGGSGVATDSEITGTSVRNGSITGMGLHGVLLGNQAEVANLRVRWNGSDGIQARDGSMVSGSTAYQNGRMGIMVQYGSTVSGSLAYRNGLIGISTSTGSTVSGNVARENGSDGIHTATGSTISDNAAHENKGNGIYTSHGATVSNNAVFNNNVNGIQVHTGSMVSGNTMYGNDGYGLRVTGSQSGYSENVISSNGVAAVSGGVEFGQNVCNGDTTCP